MTPWSRNLSDYPPWKVAFFPSTYTVFLSWIAFCSKSGSNFSARIGKSDMILENRLQPGFPLLWKPYWCPFRLPSNIRVYPPWATHFHNLPVLFGPFHMLLILASVPPGAAHAAPCLRPTQPLVSWLALKSWSGAVSYSPVLSLVFSKGLHMQLALNQYPLNECRIIADLFVEDV